MNELKKNENENMILNIENKNANVFLGLVDQTPTPTRLIKNCEEVGLFDDLNNVNPFDETFRRAIESKNNSLDINSDDLAINEDTLHTPQVILPFKINDNEQHYNLKRQKSNPKRQNSENIIFQNDNNKQRKILPKFQIRNSTIIIPAKIIPQSIPKLMINLPTDKNSVERNSTTSNEKSPPIRQLSIKEKLKYLISQKDTSIYEPDSDIKKAKTEIKIKSKTNIKNENSTSSERKRAASSRYRKKIKQDFSNLEKDKLKLQAENMELKEIIKEYQNFVLAHRHCDLTRKCVQKSPNGTTAQLLTKHLPKIEIQPSTIIMNLPKFIIQPTFGVLIDQQSSKTSQKN